MRHCLMYQGGFERNFPKLKPGTTTFEGTDGTQHPVPPIPAGPHGVIAIDSASVPVGLFCDQKFSTTQLRAAPGDSLVIYTDGISESEGPDGAQYGASSLQALLTSCRELPSRELVDKCLKEVLTFRAGSPRLKGNGPPARRAAFEVVVKQSAQHAPIFQWLQAGMIPGRPLALTG